MRSRPISNKEIKEWLDNPVTLKLIFRLEEHITALTNTLSETILGKTSGSLIKPEEMADLIQYKGQIHALEVVSELENFLEEEEIQDEEIQTDTREDSGEDSERTED